MTWDATVVSIVTGVLSSLVASLVWLIGLRRVRPDIEIGPALAEELHETAEGPPERSYVIKFLNRGRRSVVDLQFELVLIRPRRTQGGLVDMRNRLDVAGTPPLSIPSYSRGDKESHNAYRVRTYEDLRTLLEQEPNAFIRFRVFARDEWSAIGKVFEYRFHEPATDIRRGKFAKGQTFDIVPPCERREDAAWAAGQD